MISPSNHNKPQAAATLPFGEFLVSRGLLSHRQLSEALSEQRITGGRLGQVLVRLEKLTQADITNALAQHLSMDSFTADDIEHIDITIARLVPENLAKRFCLVAVGQIDSKLALAMADPLDVVAVDTIKLKTNRQIHVLVSSPETINRAIEIIYHGSDIEEKQLRDLVEFEISSEEETQTDITEADISSEVDANKAPVIRFVDLLLSQAVKSRASDIHIEPQERSMLIRMRIDGVLRDMVPPPRKMQPAVTTRIKILAHMNIAEKRLPQDGRFKIKAPGRDIDVRVSAIPTIYGEKVVMRILDSAAVNHDLDQLGFDPELLAEFKLCLAQPYGIIIVTGPTGSGKSTTLYSALNYLKNPTKNITTVEDPVEYRLQSINQIQVKPEIGLDFAMSLRSILRQDPDIILIGEIRDKETVEIAIKASLTGHLVLSTFHTNDAPSAISRLVYMGIDSYLLASTLNLVIAQRLVRRICEHCKQPIILSDDLLQKLKITPAQAAKAEFSRGRGCRFCDDTGYFGRLPIFEFLGIDDDVRNLLIAGSNEAKIRSLARKKGYDGLLESGAKRVLQGLTTAEEVLSVTFMENVKP